MTRYPQTVAAGNEVLRAAQQWARRVRVEVPHPSLLEDWERDLLHAVDAYVEVVALPQAKGPDIDADS